MKSKFTLKPAAAIALIAFLVAVSGCKTSEDISPLEKEVSLKIHNVNDEEIKRLENMLASPLADDAIKQLHSAAVKTEPDSIVGRSNVKEYNEALRNSVDREIKRRGYQ